MSANETISDEIEMADYIFGGVNLLVLLFGNLIQIIFCLFVGGLLCINCKNPFNSLWITRLLMVFCVIVMNVGVLFGNSKIVDVVIYLISDETLKEDIADHLYLSFCRVCYICIFGSQVLLTSCIAWILLCQFSFKKQGMQFKGSPFGVKNVIISNLQVILPSCCATCICVIPNLCIFAVEYIVYTWKDNFELDWIYSSYDKENRYCRYPGFTFVLFVLYLFLFLSVFYCGTWQTWRKAVSVSFKKKLIINAIVMTLSVLLWVICKTVEMGSYAVGGLIDDDIYADQISRIISIVVDMLLCYVVLIVYIVFPLSGAIESCIWNYRVHKGESGNFGYENFEIRQRQRATSFAVGDRKSHLRSNSIDQSDGSDTEDGDNKKADFYPKPLMNRGRKRERRFLNASPPMRKLPNEEGEGEGEEEEESSEDSKEKEVSEEEEEESEEEEKSEEESEEED